MKKIIYTCITDGYDIPKKHLVIPKGWDYECIIKSGGVLEARKNKILCPYFDTHDMSLWIDGDMQLLRDIGPFIERNHRFDLSVTRHPARDCIYAEYSACMKFGLDDVDLMVDQMRKYTYERYPFRNGLVATGFMIRTHTDEIRSFCDTWFEEVLVGSIRDQLSFNYAVWKSGISFGYLPLFNQIAEAAIFAHNKKR